MLVEAHKGKSRDSMAKTSVCRAKTDLTNVKYVLPAMAFYTQSSSSSHLQPWTTKYQSWTCNHTWSHMTARNYQAFLRINAVWGDMLLIYSDTSTRMKLGCKYHACLHDTIGWCTSDFSCLTFNSVTNVSDNMWGSEIDYFLYSSSLPGTAGQGPRIALLMERIYQVLYRLGRTTGPQGCTHHSTRSYGSVTQKL